MKDDLAAELDQLMVARLTSAARRHAPSREPAEGETAAAVEELTEIAGDRGDLLAEVAGLLLGYYRQTIEERKAQAAAHYCIAAGADQDLIPEWIEVGRHRAAAGRQASAAGPEADDSCARPHTREPPRPLSPAGQRKKLVISWRLRAGANRWRTFRYNT